MVKIKHKRKSTTPSHHLIKDKSTDSLNIKIKSRVYYIKTRTKLLVIIIALFIRMNIFLTSKIIIVEIKVLF